MLGEVQEEGDDPADLVHVELILEQVVNAVDENLLLLYHGVGHLLQGQKHHVVALGKKGIDVIQKLSLDVFLEVGSNELMVIGAKDQGEDDVVELVENEESEQVLVLWDVPQQTYDELEEAIHRDLDATGLWWAHDHVLYQVDDLR